MIRSILLPLADGPLVDTAREYAYWLARKDGGRIHGLAVIDIKSFEIPVMGTPDGFMPSVVTPPIAESQSLLEEMAALAKERLERFATDCGARGIACSTETRTGIPGELIAREAVAHDIVVMSRSGYSRGTTSEARLDPLVPQVIRGSIRPVLVSGRHLEPQAGVRNVLVAYDGSGHAARALAVAAELGGRPGITCSLVTVATTEESGLDTLAPAEAYLRGHGVSPRKQVAIGSKASEMICELMSAAAADLLIMGAYGHRPVREILFGSTTERVLSHCSAAVVLQS
jgi:nucleotide-binding universal stress UspA family protein